MRISTNLAYRRTRFTFPLAVWLASPIKMSLIASYPRSGSTWLRTMLTNVIFPEANSNPEIFNRVLPGLTLTRLLPALFSSIKPQIFSTHSKYFHGLKKRTVFVLRDGRDSVLSYYRFSTTRVGINEPYERWFADYVQGNYGVRWDEYTISWLTNGKKQLGEEMLVIRYEELRRDTYSQLKKVCDFLQIEYDRQCLDAAIQSSSVQNMKQWENKLSGTIQDENASFYRGGLANEWESLLSMAQRAEFVALHKDALLLAGYDSI